MLPSQLYLLLLTMATAIHAAPAASPEITITHSSTSAGTSSTHKVDPALISPSLAEAINGNDININVISARNSLANVRRSPSSSSSSSSSHLSKRAGISNSTINLTVISKKKLKRSPSPSAADEASDNHHNVHIDASSLDGQGGGIHNSTVNINFNGAKREAKRAKTTVGDHSVLLDLSSSDDDNNSTTTSDGIEDSTVHVNILPARDSKTIGDHSLLIDTSSPSTTSTADEDTTTAGDRSAVVESKHISGSTINLTVVSPKNSSSSAPSKRSSHSSRRLRRTSPKSAPLRASAPTEDEIVLSLSSEESRALESRQEGDGEWEKRINKKSFPKVKREVEDVARIVKMVVGVEKRDNGEKERMVKRRQQAKEVRERLVRMVVGVEA
ncbi:hypothetical protein MNV49_000858 [Pseudohyphozyma bogoriensis]|nr:hypothetical protein MNV49_000858 [Pseudohyphozyma bogoriensis]